MRFEQFAPALANHEVDVEIVPLLRDEYIERLYSGRPKAVAQILGDYLRRLPWLFQAGRFDLLWIEKELFPDLPGWFERLLGLFGIRYVVDYDDAIFHNYDLSGNPWRRLLARKIDKVMQGAALVVCGNQYLADRAVSAGASRVEVLPTVIDLNRYSVAPFGCPEKIVVGWVGSPSTVKYLDILIPALRALSAEYCLQLRVIGGEFSVPGMDINCRPWSEDNEVRQIQEFDIGIMPLTDSPWERGKCGYKLIQYMACGLPVVGSEVGVNREIIRHGENGFVAETAESWFHSLRVLLNDAALRSRMGAVGRSRVEAEYCVQQVAPRLARLLRTAAVAA